MSQPQEKITERKQGRFTTDAWAVTAALVLALLVKLGLIHHVGW